MFHQTSKVFLALCLLTAPAFGLVSNASCAPDASTGLDPTCWQSLDITDYVKAWYAANATAANCAKLGFAQCYMQYNGFGTMGCSTISVATCTPPATQGITYSSQQEFYVLYTIYAMYQFFLSFSQALSDAEPLAAGYVGSIVELVVPPAASTVHSKDIQFAITMALALFALTSEFASGDLKIFLKTIFAVTGQGGALSYLLNPGQSNTSDQLIQLADLSAQLSTVVGTFQTNWETLLAAWQSNATLFTSVCENGGFSGSITQSTVDQSTTLLQSLTTFVFTSALNANGIFAAKNLNTDPRQVALKTTQVNCPSFDKYGGCNGFWWDNATDTTYALNSVTDPANDQTHLLWTAADSGWINIGDMFLDANSCGEGTMTLDPTTGKVSCVSALFTCTYKFDPNDGTTQATIEFTDCPSQESWGASSGNLNCFPFSYLGPVIETQTICIGSGD